MAEQNQLFSSIQQTAMKHLLSLLLLLFLLPMALHSQPIPIRICTYNVLDYGDGEDTARVAALKKVIRAVDADILVVQEIDGESGFISFFMQVGAATLDRLVGFDGPDMDNALLYDQDGKVEYLTHREHHTALRDINEFVFRVLETSDTIHFFACNLTADDTQADREARLQQALILARVLDTIPAHHHSIVAGDLNVYSSSEPAYAALTFPAVDTSGGVRDPVYRPGNWHGNKNFADVHTQSTRLRSFGGGATGGLDDRFDFILLSPSLIDGEYIPGSYTVFGNDGGHLNDSINAMPNENVSAEIAQALHDASDHLPVYLDLVFQKQSSGVEGEPAWRGGRMDLSMRKSGE